MLKVLELPEGILAALREHSADARVRAHFTDLPGRQAGKRLRQMVTTKRKETAVLREIERVIGGRA